MRECERRCCECEQVHLHCLFLKNFLGGENHRDGEEESSDSFLRLFLIDSKSLERGLTLCNSCELDYVEILPGIACGILPYLQMRTAAKLMCGGLIRTPEELKACFDARACAVTISKMEIVNQYREKYGL